MARKCAGCGFRNCICPPLPKYPPRLNGNCPICNKPYPCLDH